MSTSITVPFDTLAFVKRLETAGIPAAHAEAQVEMLSDVIKKVEETRLQELATKGDVREVELRLEAKIETTKAELRRDIETAKVETIKWVIVTGIAVLGGVAAINRLVPPVPTYYQPTIQELRQPYSVPVPPLSPPQSPPTH
ncbi:coiled-coil domain-containing protein [Candidatus Magnetaquicoccus inordinatus]|uniref:coiled-coil domain-containing protein n=1 Tax=Candidatus Magnetaquicoccus inordinatus TaxID=2496818 RepID=UPI00102B477D|nr:coiled-coil domain-containing protein [Candidatus Magnetaquicoccus inordinatus]